ncbi:MAG: efflux RND transporter periplasmic adaptor subunit [Thermoanaerobaculia bacterium]
MSLSWRFPVRRFRGGIAALGSIAVLASACSKKPKGQLEPPPTLVEVASATSETVRESFEALGTVEADERVTIASEIDGIARELPFQEGGLVRRGQTLARLNDAELKAEVGRAQALRDQAQLNFERAKRLAEEQITSSQERDNAKAALDVAQANLNLARARLAKTQITAPFDGAVGKRNVSPGAFLRAGDVITDLARIESVKIVFAAPEAYLPQLRRGGKVSVSAVAYPDRDFTGNVEVVDPMLDPGTRSARLIARVPNPKAELRPGMSADVRAILEEHPGVTVPAESIFAEGDQNFLYKVGPDGKVQRVSVKLGIRQGGRVEVTAGLAAGDTVVRAGHQKLFEGAKVAVAGAPPAGASTAGTKP